MYVVLRRDEGGLHVGGIKLILIHNSDIAFYVVVIQQAVELVDFGVHCLTEVDPGGNYICVRQEDLLDYYPFVEYKLFGASFSITLFQIYINMSVLEDDIRDAVLAVLPGLPADKLTSLLHKLTNVGSTVKI